MRENNDIRAYAKSNGVYLWEVAEKMGILDASLSRKLRRELPQNEKKHIFGIIDNIASQKTAAQITSA